MKINQFEETAIESEKVMKGVLVVPIRVAQITLHSVLSEIEKEIRGLLEKYSPAYTKEDVGRIESLNDVLQIISKYK